MTGPGPVPACAAELLDALCAHERVLLTGPVQPDGDSLGACLALARVLTSRGVDCAVAGTPSFRYAWMPGADTMIPDEALEAGWPAVLVADGDRHRLTPQAEAAFTHAHTRAIIDHHASTHASDGYTHAWVEPEATSTCEMVFRALTAWGIPLDPPMARLLYTGTVFDTGGFRHANTTPHTHRMAAHLLECGATDSEAACDAFSAICTRVLHERSLAGLRLTGEVYRRAQPRCDGRVLTASVPLSLQAELCLGQGDLEGVVEGLVQVLGVQIAVLAIERPDGLVKLSLRSRGEIDVGAVAHQLTPTGGGHAKAAGAVFRATADEGLARAVRALEAMLP